MKNKELKIDFNAKLRTDFKRYIYDFAIRFECNNKQVEITQNDGDFLEMIFFPQNSIISEGHYSLIEKLRKEKQISYHEIIKNPVMIVVEDHAEHTGRKNDVGIKLYFQSVSDSIDGFIQFCMNEEQKINLKKKINIFNKECFI